MLIKQGIVMNENDTVHQGLRLLIEKYSDFCEKVLQNILWIKDYTKVKQRLPFTLMGRKKDVYVPREKKYCQRAFSNKISLQQVVPSDILLSSFFSFVDLHKYDADKLSPLGEYLTQYSTLSEKLVEDLPCPNQSNRYLCWIG